jgi:hypothetical protein
MKHIRTVLVLALGVLGAACRNGAPTEAPVAPGSRPAASTDTVCVNGSPGTDDAGTAGSRGTNTFGSGN